MTAAEIRAAADAITLLDSENIATAAQATDLWRALQACCPHDTLDDAYYWDRSRPSASWYVEHAQEEIVERDMFGTPSATAWLQARDDERKAARAARGMHTDDLTDDDTDDTDPEFDDEFEDDFEEEPE